MQTLQFPTPSVIESPPPKPRVSRATVIIAILGLALTASATWQGQRPSSEIDPNAVAELFVRAYLSEAGEGSEDTLAPFLGYQPTLAGMEPQQWYVTGTTSISTETAHGVTTVVVAADTLGRVGAGYGDHETQFFAVLLQPTSHGFVVMSLPHRVGGPQTSPGGSESIFNRIGTRTERYHQDG